MQHEGPSIPLQPEDLGVGERVEFQPRICALVVSVYRDPYVTPEVVKTFSREFWEKGIDPVFVEQETVSRSIDALNPDIALVSYSAESFARRFLPMPYVVLGEKGDTLQAFRSLELGAEHYAEEPANTTVLSAHMKAILKRREPRREKVFESQNVKIDFEQGEFFVEGNPVALTPTEWNLLCFLARNPGRVLPAPEILTKVWGFEYSDDREYLQTWIKQIRKKLGERARDPRLLRTLIGTGYLFDKP